MPSEPNPKHWRDSAKRARAKADQMKDPRSKRMMLGLADFYERLARRLVDGSWSRQGVRDAQRLK
jgi:hypothetical protein